MIYVRTWIYGGLLAGYIGILVYMFMYGKNGMQNVYSLQCSMQEKKTAVTQLEHTIEEFKDEIAQWESHPFYKEKIAREKLHMARRGDTVYYR